MRRGGYLGHDGITLISDKNVIIIANNGIQMTEKKPVSLHQNSGDKETDFYLAAYL